MLILYKGKRLLHTRIVRDYLIEFGDDALSYIIKLATQNQTIIKTNDESVAPLKD